LKDRVLQASLNYGFDPPDQVVFVNSLTEPYLERHSVGNNTATPLTSPFKGKTVDECWALLKQLRAETGAQIDPNIFAILDERSLRDNSALVVEADEDEGAESVRVELKLVIPRLFQYFVGDVGVDQDIGEAEDTEDGVVRITSQGDLCRGTHGNVEAGRCTSCGLTRADH
jgi:hypothetical protein